MTCAAPEPEAQKVAAPSPASQTNQSLTKFAGEGSSKPANVVAALPHAVSRVHNTRCR